jgi:prepilin-type processing-associated H-X9-DG protein
MNTRTSEPSVRANRRGLTMMDVMIGCAVAVVLLAAALPQVSRLAQDARNRTACAANLRQLGLAAISYNTRVRTTFPRLYYQPNQPPKVYSSPNVADAFANDGPRPNDVSGALFHLLKAEEVSPKLVICPGDDAKPLEEKDIAAKSNFAGGRANLSYSYTNCYPSMNAVMSGWAFSMVIAAAAPEAPLISDMNPGDRADGGPSKVAFNSPAADLRKANSFNHGQAGQNVLYYDGHVEWSDTPFAGRKKATLAYRDNIFASTKGVDAATGKGGDLYALPNDAWDSIMLPTRNDEPGKPLPTSQPAR